MRLPAVTDITSTTYSISRDGVMTNCFPEQREGEMELAKRAGSVNASVLSPNLTGYGFYYWASDANFWSAVGTKLYRGATDKSITMPGNRVGCCEVGSVDKRLFIDGKTTAHYAEPGGTVTAITDADYLDTLIGNQWAASTSLPGGALRSNSGLVTLQDGRVLLIGGTDGTEKNTTYFGTISGSTITWVAGTNYPLALFSPGVVFLSTDKIMVVGGDTTSGPITNCYEGTISGNTITWAAATAIPTASAAPAILLNNGKILRVTTSYASNMCALGTVSGTTITWTSVSRPTGTGVAGAALSLLQDGRFVFVNNANVYIGSEDSGVVTWVESTNRPVISTYPSGVCAGQDIIVIGGAFGGSKIDDTYVGRVSGDTITWSQVDDYVNPALNLAATKLNDGRILAVGGQGSAAYLGTSGVMSHATSYGTIGTPVELNGYIFVAKTDGRIFHSDNVDEDPANIDVWDPDNYLAVTESDTLHALFRHVNFIGALGDKSLEFFYDAGNAEGSVLAPVGASVIHHGAPGPETLAVLGDAAFYVSQSSSGGYQVLMVERMQPSIISTPAIARVLCYGTGHQTMRGMCVSLCGHMCYILTVGSNTIAYDIAAKAWVYLTPWAWVAATVKDGDAYLQHGTKGDIVMVSGYQDYDPVTATSANVTATIRTPTLRSQSPAFKTMKAVGLECQKWTTAPTMRYTDDDFSTYSTARTFQQPRNILYSLGRYTARAIEISHAGNEDFRLRAIHVE